MAAASSKAAQAEHVVHAMKRVDKHAKLMNSAADADNTKEALKHALSMLHELRTKHLSPKPYYELYMTVFSHLVMLEGYFHRTVAEGKRSARELYEMVQHAGNVLPRLYLMICAGPVVIRTRRMPAAAVLKDMEEMCKGVQHPTRGLFLRYFLLQKTSTLVPEAGSPYHGEGGTVEDAVSFVLSNTVAMIRLWVRMQAAADGKTRKRRARERREIRQVIGTAIDKLAGIEGVDAGMYASTILPSLLRELTESADALAQEFLFDCILQAFPVAFHVATLEPLIGAAASVGEGVSVRDLVTGLIRRISTEAGEAASAPGGADVFDSLLKATERAVAERGDRIGGAAVADIFGALVGFTAAAFPGDLEKIDTVLKRCAAAAFEGREANEAGQDAVADLLCSVWRERPAAGGSGAAAGAGTSVAAAAGSGSLRERGADSAAAGLDAKATALLGGSSALLASLGHRHRRRVAASLSDALVAQGADIATVDECQAILRTLGPLLRDEEGGEASAGGGADDAFALEQTSVARLVRCIGRGAETTADEFATVCAARKAFGFGQARRIVFTLPPVVVRLLEIHSRIAEGDGVTTKQVLRTAHETCAALSPVQPLASLRLFLLCGAATAGTRPAYDFLSQAILLHEDVPESALQRSSLLATIGTLRQCGPGGMGEEGYGTLATRCTKFAAKLLRKQHAVECVLACASLFWSPAADGADPDTGVEKPAQVATCLGKALELAGDAIPQDPALFVAVLEAHVQLFEARCPAVTPAGIRDVCSTARERIGEAMGAAADEAEAHLAAIVDHVRLAREQAAGNPAFAHWAEVTL